MALPDLFSVFYFYFKKSVTVPPFAGNHHAFTLCHILIKHRHLVPTHRAYNMAQVFCIPFFSHDDSPLSQDAIQAPAAHEDVCNLILFVLYGLRKRKCIKFLHLLVILTLLFCHIC